MLLDTLYQLKQIDDQIGIYPQSSSLYLQRAELLWYLGLNSLAIEDSRYAAKLQQKENINCFYQELYLLPQKDFSYENGKNYYALFQIILNYDLELRADWIDPLYYSERATALQNFHLFELAKRDFQNAINGLEQLDNQEKSLASVKASQSLLYSLIGDFEKGCELYEYRWLSDIHIFNEHITHRMLIPRWRGEDISNGTLILLAEQGLGDNIQYIRYAIALKQAGINVIVQNYASLNDFLAFNLAKYDIPCVSKLSNVQATHYIQMMSLPYLLDKTLQNIPFSQGYLQAEPEYIHKWTSQIKSSHKPKIGFVFGGSFQHERNAFRSIPVKLWDTIFQFNAEFHCLQIEIKTEDKITLDYYSNVYYWDHLIENFSDTAAIIEHLDLVITVDTSVAHLAAAMGKSTWLLVTYKPDFRWELNKNTSRWYQNIRLFRQEFNNDWEDVINNVYQALLEIDN